MEEVYLICHRHAKYKENKKDIIYFKRRKN